MPNLSSFVAPLNELVKKDVDKCHILVIFYI